MKKLQKYGGLAALYLAAAYLVNMILFLFVLDYPSIVDPLQKVDLIVQQQTIMVLSNLVAYVIFGVLLVVFTLALYDRLKSGSPALVQTAAVFGFIWAGSLIANGMISNSGIAPTAAMYAVDPAGAAVYWSTIETVANGLGGAFGEILGGLFTLLFSVAALKTKTFPKALHILGLLVGSVGIISTVPGLSGLVGIFGMSQMIWFIWLGICLLRSRSNPAVQESTR